MFFAELRQCRINTGMTWKRNILFHKDILYALNVDIMHSAVVCNSDCCRNACCLPCADAQAKARPYLQSEQPVHLLSCPLKRLLTR